MMGMNLTLMSGYSPSIYFSMRILLNMLDNYVASLFILSNSSAVTVWTISLPYSFLVASILTIQPGFGLLETFTRVELSDSAPEPLSWSDGSISMGLAPVSFAYLP